MTLEEVLLEARAKQRALEMAEELKKDEIWRTKRIQECKYAYIII